MTGPRTPLYATGGFVNPIHAMLRKDYGIDLLYGPQFYDSDTKRFYSKQGPKFDGGWRWYLSDIDDYLIIYNKFYNPQACAEIAQWELENQGHPLDPEFTLQCAQGRCMVEHNYFESRAWIAAQLANMFHFARKRLILDIRNNVV